MSIHLAALLSLVVAATCGRNPPGGKPLTAESDDWPCFRGPGRTGVSAAKGLPLDWSDTKNILWKNGLARGRHFQPDYLCRPHLPDVLLSGDSRSTPLLVSQGDSHELVFHLKSVHQGGKNQGIIGAVDPRNGRRLWECQALDNYLNPSPIAHEGVIYATGSHPNASVAIRAGGRGAITGTHKTWEIKHGSEVCTPVFYEGHCIGRTKRAALPTAATPRPATWCTSNGCNRARTESMLRASLATASSTT